MRRFRSISAIVLGIAVSAGTLPESAAQGFQPLTPTPPAQTSAPLLAPPTVTTQTVQPSHLTSPTQVIEEIVAKPDDPTTWPDNRERLAGLVGERFYGVYAGNIKLGYMRNKLEQKTIGTVSCYKAEQEVLMLDPKLGERVRIETYLFKAEAPWELLERANIEKIGPKTMASSKEWREGEVWKFDRTVADQKLPTQSFSDPPLLLSHLMGMELWVMRSPQVGDVLNSKALSDTGKLKDDQHSIKRVADDGRGGKLYIVSTQAEEGNSLDVTLSGKGEVRQIRSDRFLLQLEPQQKAQDLRATRELFLKMPAQ